MRSPFHGLIKAQDKPRNSLNGNGYAFFFGGTTSGKAVNERSAMQMTAVYACVRILSEAIASLPLHVYRYTDTGGKEKATNIRCTCFSMTSRTPRCPRSPSGRH